MVSSDVVFRMGQCVSLSSSWWSHDVPNQETANYRLQATLCPQPNFVNKVLLKQPFHFISVLLGCFPATTPGLSRCHKDHLVYSDTQSLKQNTYYLALYRKRLLAPVLGFYFPEGHKNLFFFFCLFRCSKNYYKGILSNTL